MFSLLTTSYCYWSLWENKHKHPEGMMVNVHLSLFKDDFHIPNPPDWVTERASAGILVNAVHLESFIFYSS